jgi:hypothetical protein
LALRCCVHAQKRPRPSWLVCQCFACASRVLVPSSFLSSPTSLSANDPFRRHHAAAVRLRSARLDHGLLFIWTLTGAASPSPFRHLHRGTQRHVDGRRTTTFEPRSVFVGRCTPPRSSQLPRDDSARVAAAFDAFRRATAPPGVKETTPADRISASGAEPAQCRFHQLRIVCSNTGRLSQSCGYSARASH